MTTDISNPSPQSSETPAGGAPPVITPPVGDTAPAPFYSAFSADLKDNPTLARFKTPEAMARSLIAAESRLGVPADQLLRMPAKPDEPGAFKEIYTRLGAPETVDGYKFELGENLSEGDKAAVGEFAKSMFEAGPFPPQFVGAAVNWWSGKVAEQAAADEAVLSQHRADGDAELRQAWGAKYEQTSQEVGKLINDLGGAELAKEFELAGGVADNPKMAKLLATLASRMAESGPPAGGGSPAMPGQLTPVQAKARVAEIEGGPALRDPNHAEHKAVVEERGRLLVLANTPA